MGQDHDVPTIEGVIAQNVRRLRSLNSWSQDEVARRARQNGLRWSRAVVASVEAGTKTLDLSEVVLLSLAVNASVDQLLSGTGWVRVGEASLRLRVVRDILGGGQRSVRPADMKVRLADVDQEALANMRDFLDEAQWRSTSDPRQVERAAGNEAEQNAARRLHIPPLLVSLAAYRLWGRSLTEERDRRLDEVSEPPGSERGVRTLRGHITRKLLTELEPMLKKGP